MSALDVLVARARPLKLQLDKVGFSPEELLACGVLSYVMIATFWRLKFGAEITDEAFYAAITHRFALGDWPYLDEFNLRQTASLLPVPFYWAYLKIKGAEGTVYFLRILYFCVQGGVAWTVYRFALPRVPRAFALVAASFPFTFFPFLIPTCSYNSLGAMFFAAGSLTALTARLDDPRPRTFLAAGVIHGLACVAYPPMAVPVLLHAFLLPFAGSGTARSPLRELSGLLRYAVGVAIVAGLLVPFLVPGLIHHGVAEALHYETMTTQVRSSAKAREVINSALQLIPFGSGTVNPPGGAVPVTMVAVLAVIAKLWPNAKRWVVAFVVAYLGYYFSEQQAGYALYLNQLYLAIYLAAVAGFFFVFVESRRERHAFVLGGWIPSLSAAFITALATSNPGCMNGGNGAFAAACVAMVAAPMAADVASFSGIGRLVGVLVLAAIPLGQMSINLKEAYRTGPVATYTARVRFGPYKGLWSTPARVKEVEDLTREVRAALTPGEERMLVYYDFPTPYLAASVRPAMPTVWTDSRAHVELLLPYYQSHRTGNGIVFVQGPKPKLGTCPPLEELVEDPSRLIKDMGWFRIYREPPR